MSKPEPVTVEVTKVEPAQQQKKTNNSMWDDDAAYEDDFDNEIPEAKSNPPVKEKESEDIPEITIIDQEPPSFRDNSKLNQSKSPADGWSDDFASAKKPEPKNQWADDVAFEDVEEVIDSPKVAKPVLSPQAQKLKKATRGWNDEDLPETVSPSRN